MKIAFIVMSQQKGFWASVAKACSELGHDISIVIDNLSTLRFFEINYPELKSIIIDLSEGFDERNDVVKEALRIEKKYDISLSNFIAQDRGYGRGYLTNADGYPKRIEAFMNNENKLGNIIEQFRKA